MGLQHNLICYLEPRLSQRYESLIKEHMGVNPTNAPDVKAQANHKAAWSTNQAAWRFFQQRQCGISHAGGAYAQVGS